MNKQELDFVWELYTHLDNIEPGEQLLEAILYFSMKYDFDIEELPGPIFTAVKNKIKEIHEDRDD